MSIEEIIKNLKHMVETCDAGGTVVWDKWIKTAREAIALLRTPPDAQPNEPLTLEELRDMVGKPVWITRDYGPDIGWAVIGSFASPYGVYFGTERGSLRLPYEDCGETWTAYRRPPKED